MTAPPSPKELAATLGPTVAARVAAIQGVADLCPGWRDLVTELGVPARALPPRSFAALAVYRAGGVEVAIGSDGLRVDVAVVLRWPHRATDVCDAVQSEVSRSTAELTGIRPRHIHVAVPDVHLP